jgi:hypothetical protein
MQFILFGQIASLGPYKSEPTKIQPIPPTQQQISLDLVRPNVALNCAKISQESVSSGASSDNFVNKTR